jgi:chaperonin GroEL
MAMKRGIDKAVEIAVSAVQAMSKPVSGDMIAQVGTISANTDHTIGGIIAEAMKKVGKDGVITVEGQRRWSPNFLPWRGCSSTVVIFLRIVTDAERMEVVLEDPYILIHEKKIGNMKTSCRCLSR